MYKKKTTLALSLLIVSSLSGCANLNHKHNTAELTSQSMTAVNWLQTSGEYRALAYQAFNSARLEWDSVSKKPTDKYAVIVDLDETMLDNSAYSAWQIKHNQPYSDKTWSQWTQSRQALAVPGAVEFARYISRHNGAIFYVSNRAQQDFTATIENMRQLGFPDVNEKTVLLKTDSSNKQARFNSITADGYNVIIYIGDNLNDFGSATYHKSSAERRQFAEDNQKLFGTRYIILPNPMYGDWEGALTPGYYKLSAGEQLQARQNALRAWSGK